MSLLRQSLILRPLLTFYLGNQTGRDVENGFMRSSLHCIRYLEKTVCKSASGFRYSPLGMNMDIPDLY
jgi:hypothetical protein